MSKARLFLAAASTILLWACDAPEQPQTTTVTAKAEQPRVSTGNQYSDQLLAMSDGERADIFQRLMQASGERCPTVERTFYQGIEEVEKQAFWNVDCGGEDWIVSIDRQSSTRLLECAVTARIGGTKCWVAFKS